MITGMPRVAIAVQDFPGVVSLFRDKLGMPVLDISDDSVSSLGASLAMCVPAGGSNIELMSPAIAEAPLSQSLQSFLNRRGEGLFALMLEAPDPNAEAEVLLERGLNVLPLMAGAGGRDVHPNSTHGVLIRVYPVNSFVGEDPGDGDDANATGLSGISRVIIAVKDIDHAALVYGQMFGMEISTSTLDSARGVRTAICTPPSGGVIELVAVENASQPFAQAIAEFIDNNREGMYALVLQSGDLAATANALTRRGITSSPAADSSSVLELDTSATFGALIRIEAA